MSDFKIPEKQSGDSCCVLIVGDGKSGRTTHLKQWETMLCSGGRATEFQFDETRDSCELFEEWCHELWNGNESDEDEDEDHEEVSTSDEESDTEYHCGGEDAAAESKSFKRPSTAVSTTSSSLNTTTAVVVDVPRIVTLENLYSKRLLESEALEDLIMCAGRRKLSIIATFSNWASIPKAFFSVADYVVITRTQSFDAKIEMFRQFVGSGASTAQLEPACGAFLNVLRRVTDNYGGLVINTSSPSTGKLENRCMKLVTSKPGAEVEVEEKIVVSELKTIE